MRVGGLFQSHFKIAQTFQKNIFREIPFIHPVEVPAKNMFKILDPHNKIWRRKSADKISLIQSENP
jgi:hypothetical protein